MADLRIECSWCELPLVDCQLTPGGDTACLDVDPGCFLHSEVQEVLLYFRIADQVTMFGQNDTLDTEPFILNSSASHFVDGSHPAIEKV